MAPGVTVAVLGARGGLGIHVLSSLRSSSYEGLFAEVRAVTSAGSNLSDDQRAQLSVGNTKHFEVDYDDDGASLGSALKGVDFVVNTNNFPASEIEKSSKRKANILSALKSNAVSVYLPSEFGIDWRFNDYQQQDWKYKAAHQIKARAIPSLKVIGCYIGLFSEDSFGPWFGLDFPNYVLHPVGSPKTRTAYTYRSDVGKAVASIAATFARSPSTYQQLPDHIRMWGSLLSVDEVADVFAAADPTGKRCTIEPVDLAEYEKAQKADPKKLESDPSGWLRLLMGNESLDFENLAEPGEAKGLQGEGVGGGKTVGRDFLDVAPWKTVQEYAESVKGRPWC